MNHSLTYSHELFAVGKRYQFVAWAYLFGFMVPVPFWIIHRYWPKLRANYLYTPVIWYVSVEYDTAAQVDGATATTLDGFALESTPLSFRTSQLPGSRSGTSELATLGGLTSTIIFWLLLLTEELR